MGINIKCDKCQGTLTVQGGLVFSPPVNDNVSKYHLCEACYEKFDDWLRLDAVNGDCKFKIEDKCSAPWNYKQECHHQNPKKCEFYKVDKPSDGLEEILRKECALYLHQDYSDLTKAILKWVEGRIDKMKITCAAHYPTSNSSCICDKIKNNDIEYNQALAEVRKALLGEGI